MVFLLHIGFIPHGNCTHTHIHTFATCFKATISQNGNENHPMQRRNKKKYEMMRKPLPCKHNARERDMFLLLLSFALLIAFPFIPYPWSQEGKKRESNYTNWNSFIRMELHFPLVHYQMMMIAIIMIGVVVVVAIAVDAVLCVTFWRNKICEWVSECICIWITRVTLLL